MFPFDVLSLLHFYTKPLCALSPPGKNGTDIVGALLAIRSRHHTRSIDGTGAHMAVGHVGRLDG